MPDGVTSIGEYAFGNCTNLKSITIPDGVTSIKEDTFHGCTNLKNISIPDSVTSIGKSAFRNCAKLESITIPDSVTIIKEDAFHGCTNLESITIPDSVKSIGGSAFGECANLKSITLPRKATIAGELCFSWCKNLESFTIPDGVTSIGEYAFYACTNLKSITIPDVVTSIGESAFGDCTNLKSITIPDGVTSIKEDTFHGCTNLENISIPDSVTSIGKSAFSGCTNLESITIPDSVTSIGESAFGDCTNLKSITIPDSVTSIEESAFSGCINLKSITIPDSVTSIEESAFYDCNNLTRIIGISGSYAEEYAKENYFQFQARANISNKIQSDKPLSTSVEIVKNNPLMQKNAGEDLERELNKFSAMLTNVKCIKVSKSDCDIDYSDTLTAYNGSEKNIILPDGITVIGEDAFLGNKYLTSVVVPEGVKTIENGAFWMCLSLKNIVLPSTLRKIGENAFNSCAELTSIMIPDGVVEICDNVFTNCKKLKDIYVPDSATDIGEDAFYTFNESMLIHTSNGSTAEIIAKEHDWKVDYNTAPSTESSSASIKEDQKLQNDTNKKGLSLSSDKTSSSDVTPNILMADLSRTHGKVSLKGAWNSDTIDLLNTVISDSWNRCLRPHFSQIYIDNKEIFSKKRTISDFFALGWCSFETTLEMLDSYSKSNIKNGYLDAESYHALVNAIYQQNLALEFEFTEVKEDSRFLMKGKILLAASGGNLTVSCNELEDMNYSETNFYSPLNFSCEEIDIYDHLVGNRNLLFEQQKAIKKAIHKWLVENIDIRLLMVKNKSRYDSIYDEGVLMIDEEFESFIRLIKTELKPMIKSILDEKIQPPIKNLYPRMFDKRFDGKTFVFTGEADGYTRDELKDIVERFGGVARQQLSGKTDFLVYGEEPGAVKIDEAKKRGIIVMNINEFFQLIH